MNSTIATRLKIALERLNISQTEAARKCGVSQQSINYIINNNLSTSKLGTSIASSLGINPEWLVLGKGRFYETKFYEIPIISSYIILKKFEAGSLDPDALNYVFIEVFLGEKAFAFQTELDKLAICMGNDLDNANKSISNEYLCVSSSRIEVTEQLNTDCYSVFEWRKRCHEF